MRCFYYFKQHSSLPERSLAAKREREEAEKKRKEGEETDKIAERRDCFLLLLERRDGIIHCVS